MQRSSEAKVETTIVRPAGFTPSTSTMDVPRPHVARKKKKRRIMIIARLDPGFDPGDVLLSRLKPAVPSVDRSTVWVDTVKRGPMVRQVRGLGTLVPEEIRWIAANTEGRVEKIVVRPGAQVEPDTVLLELTSPELEQAGARCGIAGESGGSGTDDAARDVAARVTQPGIDYGAGPFRVSNRPRWSARPTTS